MRIAFASTILSYPWGGADTLWTHAAEAASARGDDLLLCLSSATAGHPRVAALVERGARLHLQSAPAVPRTIGARVRRKLGQLLGPDDPVVAALAAFRPDLVVISLGGTYDLATRPAWTRWLASTATPFRLIANWQEEQPTLDPEGMDEIRGCFDRADAIHFVSTRNLEVTRGHLARPFAHASVIQNPLRWTPADVTPWPASPPWSLAAVARLEPVKGLDLLLPALARALPRDDAWRLDVFGRGPDEAALQALANRLGLGTRVRFPGYVGDLRAIWSAHHLLVSPAREEGVPMTLPEAMLCGRPVLATPVGGARDWIEDGRTGFVCAGRDEEALATALAAAWERRMHWAAMGAEAATSALARYRASDHLRLLAPLAASRPAAVPSAS